ncbi:hypothetical protein O0555_24940, partial [Brevibacillus laterosporus]
GSRDKPGGANLAPILKWDYYDPQGKKQYAFDMRIKRVSDNFMVDNPYLTSIIGQYYVPSGKLEAGVVYSWSVRVKSVDFILGEW